MLLTTIVQIFDEELIRLRAMRAILAPLQQPLSPLIAAISEVEQLPAPVPTITRLPAREAPMKRVRKSHHKVLPSAFTANIPSGPVVVSPTVTTVPSQPAPPTIAAQPGSFAAMIRAAEQGLRS